MADLLVLSNETNDGNSPVEEIFRFGDVNTTSAMTGAAVNSTVIAGPMHRAGRIVDFAISVIEPALSASGFVSGNVSANLFVHKTASGAISALTTLPSIAGPVANSAAVVAKATCAGGGTSAVMNTTGAEFAAGDVIFLNRTAQSAASAGPGNTAVKGFGSYIKVRYTAV